jgi:hypothetical protein
MATPQSQVPLADLQAALKQISEVKRLAAEAGIVQRRKESDADFVIRISSELQTLVQPQANAAPAPSATGTSTTRWLLKKGVKLALLAALGLPTSL